MKGVWSIRGRNTTVSNHRSLFLFLVMLPAIFCMTEPLWADVWKPVIPSGAVPGARSGHSMVLIGGKVYLFGGEGNSGVTAGQMAANGVLLNDLWYLEGSSEWKKVTPNNTPPKARKNYAAVAYGEKMHIFFGQGDQGPLGDIWAYDTGLNIWQEVQTQGAERPSPLSGHSVVVAGGTAYLFGGQDQYGNVFGDLWSLDLTTHTWNHLQGYNLPSKGHRAVTDGAKMYVYGGDNGQLVYDHLLSYDYAAKQWQKISPQSSIPPGRTCPIATLDANKILISGGRGQTEELGDTWEYDIVSNQWVRKADGPVQSRSAAVVLPTGSSEYMISTSLQTGSYILLFGGERDGQFLDEMWKYSSASNAPKPTPAINLLLLN